MAANGGSAAGGGGGGGRGGDGKPPPRPTIAVPSRSSIESILFRGGGGGASEASPGPLTLVSSFFAADPESECRSFTQLLVGAINSPASAAARSRAAEQEKETERGSAGSGLVRLGQNRPPSLSTTSSPQLFTVPPGLSPASLLDSPAFFSSGLGNHGMSYQQALAQVTSEATENASSFLSATTTSMAQQPVPENPLIRSNNITFDTAEDSISEQRSQPTANLVDKPADDGYNWRKYGQKMVKGSEFPRGYYKCTHPNCPVTKKVERSVDGQVTEIIYKGQHNHQCPRPEKHSKEGRKLSSNYSNMDTNHDNTALSETSSYGAHGNSIPSIPIRDQQTQSGSSENEVAENRRDEGDDTGPDPKRRYVSASLQKTLTEPRIVVQTTSEVDLLDDGYRWRKYGQKVVKGNRHPRSYYKCTYLGCNVRKHIERASSDPKAVITTYEGKHNHDLPAARNSSHNTANAAASQHAQSNHSSLLHTNFRSNNQMPIATLHLKKEDEIT
ncbi:hypothetical protein Cni_G03130 [Canna indica]|uniref:WRKY domain-containing protein n=1 Tax=Canna indica TaxID=4628 RepID=A0AAQ3JQM3_9LILI|nr:hypothetical protein Cni_G03130 [Canna indica]